VRSRLVALAYACDIAFGDPAWFPHPVRAIGAACVRAERVARRFTHDDPQRELVAGAIVWSAIVGGTYACTALALALARRADARIAAVVQGLLAWNALAVRDLLAEAEDVRTALDRDDVPRARLRVARIVGRDTADLDSNQIARATIETLAESACDGIVAPLLALALGGVPLALAFKAINTLDSMIGHHESPYTYFGRIAARADDVACFLPARVTALAFSLGAFAVGGDSRGALRSARDDGRRHRSPNAGLSEAAMAGALGVRLGGTNTYDGVAIAAPELNARGRAPESADIRRAQRLVALAAAVVALAAIGSVRAFERRS
jgi:adenosylcobinamide-phosphate synthase